MPTFDWDSIFFRKRRLRGIFRRLLGSRLGRTRVVGRYLLPRLLSTPLPQDERDVILVLLHEASRTGAPILGWNIIRGLSARYRVVCVPFGGGELEGDLREASAASTIALPWVRQYPGTLRGIAQSLIANYRPLYVIANSVETHGLIPYFSRAGVPVVALFHEFAAYTRPLAKLDDVFGWAGDVVFSSRMTIKSAQDYYPGLETRAGLHLIPQGRSEIPLAPRTAEDAAPAPLRPEDRGDAFVVLGAGSVHLRKGVETFISTAAAARRLRPDLPLLFVWIGEGFLPQQDLAYSIYLDEQIKRSDLGDSLIMRPAVDDIDSLYPQADVFLLSSRLDPQPNVAIDAMTLGIPVVCFEGAAGTAEVLASDPSTRGLVVPHLDAHAAAEVICGLADRRDDLGGLHDDVRRLARATFDMPSYIERIDQLGRAAAGRPNARDAQLIETSALLDPGFVLAPHEKPMSRAELAHTAMMRWRLWGGSTPELARMDGRRAYRRACPGFHPGIYALAHEESCLRGERDPLALWLESGRPAGPWSRRIHSPKAAGGEGAGAPELGAGLRSALHAHFHYAELAGDLLARLLKNRIRPDLFVTTDTEAKATRLRAAFASYDGKVDVRVMPNRGRDIGPLLTGLAETITDGGYDVIGHVHAKRSRAIDAAMGERWRGFLWENLVGGRSAMVDTVVAAFAGDPSLGLLFTEDPHVVGWNENREIAQALAERMGIGGPLPVHFDFPLGTMFWARPAALQPLVELGFGFGDYPPEPLPDDGTVLHALERLIPFAVRKAGFGVDGVRVPGTTW